MDQPMLLASERKRGVSRPAAGLALGVAVAASTLLVTVAARSQTRPPRYSLGTIAVPAPPNLTTYVRDERTLLVLGKALFWDMQVSSDNRVACATCHFHAGADHRLQNQLVSTKGPLRPNEPLGAQDFPFQHAAVMAAQRVGSAGVFAERFDGLRADGGPDSTSTVGATSSPTVRGLLVRQVTVRNAPSVINAVFNFRDFWDGRASNIFTGRTPAGDSDSRANVLVNRGALVAERLRLENAGLASQAVAPPVDGREMSADGRSWPTLGRKMLGARPLALQAVTSDDSVLGPYRDASGRGLSATSSYLALVRAAFQPEYWNGTGRVDGDGRPVADGPTSSVSDAFTQAEYNFPIFFALAIQAYETTLISGDSPYDHYLDGDSTALTALQYEGLGMYQQRLCGTCHVDPELTLATYSGVFGRDRFRGLGPDAGFFFTGVEPAANDAGFGGADAFGVPLSLKARQKPELARFMHGWFKMPSLRNVEFTGPYFHSGSKATLEEVTEYYTHGGDYPPDPGILVGWSAIPDGHEPRAFAAFMKSFSDDRVRFERAPFDHPELCVSIGHVVDDAGRAVPKADGLREAADRWAEIDAVGAGGSRVPLQTFDELLHGVGRDGSRAHNLETPCAMPAVQ